MSSEHSDAAIVSGSFAAVAVCQAQKKWDRSRPEADFDERRQSGLLASAVETG